MCIIAPSLLEADYQCLGKQLGIIEKAGAEYVHIDIMDGNFVPGLSFGMKMVEGLRSAGNLIFDIHMMVVEPIRFLEQLHLAGADVVTVHYEACRDICGTLHAVKNLGMHAGIALNPETPVTCLNEEIIALADVIQIMTVRPGLEGQKLIPETLEKIRSVKKRLRDMGRPVYLEADGGITFSNGKEVSKAGADIIVSGKALFEGELESNIRKMKQLVTVQC